MWWSGSSVAIATTRRVDAKADRALVVASPAGLKDERKFINILWLYECQLVIIDPMKSRSSPLSAQIATLRSPTPSGVVGGHWLHRSIIELIIACLNRLFTRLDRMLELWQAGTLPIPAPPTQTPHTTTQRESAGPAPSRPPARRRIRFRHPAAPAASAEAASAANRASLIPNRQPASVDPAVRSRAPTPRIRASHGPPPSASPKNTNSRRGIGASIILRYQNK